MPSYSLSGKRIWITGASSGIGKYLAELFSERGARVALSARSEGKLKNISDSLPNDSLVLPLDVTNRAGNHEVLEVVEDQWEGLDCVLLNAGTSEYVDLDSPSDFDAELVERITRINYLGMVYGVEASLPLLEKSPDPYLVAMSSSAAYGPLPRAEAYGASKSAIKYFFESLRYDLQEFDIPVSVICPGFVKTPLTDKNEFPMPFLISPEDAAERIVSGMRKQKVEIHFPRRFTLLVKLLNLLPGALYRWLIGTLLKRA